MLHKSISRKCVPSASMGFISPSLLFIVAATCGLLCQCDVAAAQGNDNGVVRVKVTQNQGSKKIPVADAAVTAVQPPSQQKVIATLDDTTQAYTLQLSPGDWQISATPTGQQTIVHPSMVTVVAGVTTDVEISFRSTTVEIVSPALALVSVENKAKKNADSHPDVAFFETGSDDPLPATVEPLSAEELAAFGASSDDTATSWYLAESHGPLPQGRYVARASMIGVAPITSNEMSVEIGNPTIFSLTLKAAEQVGTLSGTVARQISEGARQPLADWKVIAVNQTSGESRTAISDPKGKYELSLPAGSWWIRSKPTDSATDDADSLQLPETKPIAVDVAASDDLQHDITITQKNATTESTATQLAIVGVTGDPPAAVPVVRFTQTNVAAAGDDIGGETEKLSEEDLDAFGLTADSKTAWYISQPKNPLPEGQYTATATLPDFGTSTSDRHSVTAGESSYFHITITPTKKQGSMAGQVTIADSSPPKPIQNVRIEIWNDKAGKHSLTSPDGSFTVKELTPGAWWVTAAAEEYDAARPILVKVDDGAEARVNISLKPTRPSVTDLVALVGVEGWDDKTLPELEFQRPGSAEESDFEATANVEPIDGAAAEKLLGKPAVHDSWSWFIARPQKPLPAGTFTASAGLTDRGSKTSAAGTARQGFQTVLEVRLFKPEEQPTVAQSVDAAIHGRVYGQNESGEPLGFVGGSKIELVDEGGLTIASATTNRNGYYKIASLTPGLRTYRVHADGYQPQDAGRSLLVQPSNKPVVVNFTVIKGSEDPEIPPVTPATLTIGAWTTVHGNAVRVDNATVTIWKHRRNAKADTRPVPPGLDYESVMEPGTYTVIAAAEGFAESRPETITIGEGKNTKHRIYLEPQQTTTTIRAIVFARSADPIQAADLSVRLRSVDGSFDRGIDIERVVGGSGLTVFQGDFAEQITSGEYFLEASSDGFSGGQSSITKINTGRTNFIEAILWSQTESSSLSGTVTADKMPVAGAAIELRNRQGEFLRTESNAVGDYQITLPPGLWYATPQTPPDRTAELQQAMPTFVTIVKGQETKHDFMLSRWKPNTKRPDTSLVLAVIGVAKSKSTPRTPTVTFTNQDGTIFDGTIRSEASELIEGLNLPESNATEWFVSKPQLPDGSFSAEAFLEGYETTASQPLRVVKGAVTVFYLALRPKQQITMSGLTVSVMDSHSDGQSYVPNATVELFGSASQKLLSTVGGVTPREAIKGGMWFLRAHAKGYQSSEIRQVLIKPGDDENIAITLDRVAPKRPVQPAYGFVTITAGGNCTPYVDPTAEFVSISEDGNRQSVPGIVRLMGETPTSQVYRVDPQQPLEVGNWRLVAASEHVRGESQPQAFTGDRLTVFQTMLKMPTPSALLMISAWPNVNGIDATIADWGRLIAERDGGGDWDALTKRMEPLLAKSLANATIRIHPTGDQGPGTVLSSGEVKSGLSAGHYIAVISAPGYETVQQQVILQCSPVTLNVKLEPFPTGSKDQGELMAIVRVVSKKIEQEVPPASGHDGKFFYLNPTNSKYKVVSLQVDQSDLATVPAVSFIHQQAVKASLQAHSAVVTEMNSEQMADLDISETTSEKWYWAEAKSRLPVGTWTAKATLKGYQPATAGPEELTSDQPTVFRMTLQEEGTKPLNTNLVVRVATDPPTDVSAKVTIRRLENTALLTAPAVGQLRTNDDSPAHFPDLVPDSYSVRVDAPGYTSYAPAEPVILSPGNVKEISVQLLPTEQVKDSVIEVLAYISRKPATVEARSTEEMVTETRVVIETRSRTDDDGTEIQYNVEVPVTVQYRRREVRTVNPEGKTPELILERLEPAYQNVQLPDAEGNWSVVPRLYLREETIPLSNVTKLSPQEFASRGISLAEFPSSEWDIYTATTNLAAPAANHDLDGWTPDIFAGAIFDGWEVAQSSRKTLLPDSHTTLEVFLWPDDVSEETPMNAVDEQIEKLRNEFNPKQKELDQLTVEQQELSKRLAMLKENGEGESESATKLTRQLIEKGLRIRELKKAKTAVEIEIKTITQERGSPK